MAPKLPSPLRNDPLHSRGVVVYVREAVMVSQKVDRNAEVRRFAANATTLLRFEAYQQIGTIKP
jgi:hypothetical protein